mmetsp:Transcript_16547/g.18713  ORF Transcript_16547/g.18713 Transcript_16547/m.18713 type:complete len:349 (-) Transcript_16547:156-1202(-)
MAVKGQCGTDFSTGCGLNGVCVNSTCICNNGWFESSEFFFFGSDDSEEKTGQLPCDTNRKLIQLLYYACLLSGIAAMLLHGLVAYELSGIKAFRKLRGVYIASVFISLNIVWTTLRLVSGEGEERLFGQDVAFTILYAIILVGFEYLAIFFIVNMGTKLVRHYPLLVTTAEKRMKRSKRIAVVSFVLATISFFMLCSIPFLKPDLGRLTFLILIGLQTVDAFLLAFFAWYSLGYLNGLIARLINNKGEFTRFDLEPEVDQEVLIKLRRIRPKLKRGQNNIAISNLCKVFLTSQVLFWDFSATLWKYYLPALQTIWMVVTIVIILPNFTFVVNKKKKFAKVVDVQELLI